MKEILAQQKPGVMLSKSDNFVVSEWGESASMTSTVKNGLKCINSELPDDWEAKLVPDEGRIYYVE